MTLRRAEWDDDEREALEALEEELEAIQTRYRDAPALDLLRAERAGVLPNALGDLVEAHLDRSAWAVTLVEGAEAADPTLEASAVNRLRAVITTRIAGKRNSRTVVSRLWRPALVAAGAAAVVYMVVVAKRVPNERPFETPNSPPVAVIPAAPAFRLALEKPDVKLTTRALVLRGDRNHVHFIDDIAPALNAYRANDYAAAAREFATLHDRYPDAVEVSFYLGISRLFLGESAGAVSALESARTVNDDTFDDDIRWYLAVAYERSGQLARARVELDTLCRGRSAYAARACGVMPQLKGQPPSEGRK